MCVTTTIRFFKFTFHFESVILARNMISTFVHNKGVDLFMYERISAYLISIHMGGGGVIVSEFSTYSFERKHLIYTRVTNPISIARTSGKR